MEPTGTTGWSSSVELGKPMGGARDLWRLSYDCQCDRISESGGGDTHPGGAIGAAAANAPDRIERIYESRHPQDDRPAPGRISNLRREPGGKAAGFELTVDLQKLIHVSNHEKIDVPGVSWHRDPADAEWLLCYNPAY